jgi:hypothetical protein
MVTAYGGEKDFFGCVIYSFDGEAAGLSQKFFMNHCYLKVSLKILKQ